MEGGLLPEEELLADQPLGQKLIKK